MGNFGKWLLGIIILAIVALLVGLYAPAPWGAKANSVNMGKSIETTLGANSGVTVDMSGNVAKLSGELASDGAVASAIKTAEGAQCEKCADREAGKRWHIVDGSGLTVKKYLAEPFTLNGVRTAEGGVVLDGYVQNEDARIALLAEAERLFPGKVTDQTVLVADGAPNANWNKVAFAYLGGLSQMDSGRFSMTNLSSDITGKAATVGVRDGINAAISSLPGQYKGGANIAVANAAAVNVGAISSGDVCQGLFDNLKGDSKVSFAYNRAEISGIDSETLLNNLASAAMQCSSFMVTVEGHTDADGADAYNLDLSQRRANAVEAYLVSRGVAPANVSAIGYGETNPIASNETPDGMAKNRRIEFKITQSN